MDHWEVSRWKETCAGVFKLTAQMALRCIVQYWSTQYHGVRVSRWPLQKTSNTFQFYSYFVLFPNVWQAACCCQSTERNWLWVPIILHKYRASSIKLETNLFEEANSINGLEDPIAAFLLILWRHKMDTLRFSSPLSIKGEKLLIKRPQRSTCIVTRCYVTADRQSCVNL